VIKLERNSHWQIECTWIMGKEQGGVGLFYRRSVVQIHKSEVQQETKEVIGKDGRSPGGECATKYFDIGVMALPDAYTMESKNR